MKRKPTLRDFKKATEICTVFQANVYFGYTGEGSEVDVRSRDINIDLKEVPDMDWFWSLIFHELGHIWCWDNNKYYTYHADNLSKIAMGLYVRKYGLKVERYVDKIGRRLGRESGIKFTYKDTYKSKSDVSWYRNWVDRNYPL